MGHGGHGDASSLDRLHARRQAGNTTVAGAGCIAAHHGLLNAGGGAHSLGGGGLGDHLEGLLEDL
eukprot:2899305-Alexandrium_andersonii.AAC.1